MQNKNTQLPNRHTLYVADSGGGKSQALMQNPEVPSQGVRTFLYDPNEDHPWCLRVEKISEFARLAKKSVEMSLKTGKGFRLAYCGNQSVVTHEAWCKVVCSLLDGRYSTYLLDEELASSVRRIDKADEEHLVLLNQARKFGGIYHATAQKSEEIPKTAFTQCKEKWVGAVDMTTAKKFATQMPVDPRLLVDQDDLNFHVYSKRRLGREPIITKLTGKNPATVTHKNRIHTL